MREIGERLYTPGELAKLGIISLVKQWEERKSERLQCYRIGRKVLYAQRHVDAYLASCESGAAADEGERDAA